MASLTQWTWQALGIGDGQRSLACYSPQELYRVGLDSVNDVN